MSPHLDPERDGSRVRRGRVREVLPSQLFLLRLESGGQVRAHLSVELRMHYVRLLPNQLVEVELSPYDPSRGRILAILNEIS